MDVLPATIDECNLEQRRLAGECVAIRGKMELAQANGVADPSWIARCQSAIRHRKADIRALSIRKAHLISDSKSAFDAAFKETAIAILDQDTTANIFRQLHRRHPELEGRYE